MVLPFSETVTSANSVFNIKNDATNGYAAILGEGLGNTSGVVGWGSQGAGVLGYSYVGTGVHGYVETGNSPIAIYGQNESVLGTPIAIKGKVDVESGYSGHFSGGRFYVSGNIGIGTTTPVALLHANGIGTGEGNVVFVGDVKSSNPGNPPAAGAGTRMMWYPDMAAFRVGDVVSNQWDKANIGYYSVAMGNNTKANNSTSFAVGNETTASGGASTAMGNNTNASGDASTASGISTVASGFASNSMCGNTTAKGNYSVAMGINTVASSYAGFSIGRYNVGAGNATSWLATDPLFEIGNGTSSVAKNNAFTVLKNGRVGIGTSSPGAGLHLKGASFPESFMYIESNSGQDAGIRFYEGTTVKWHIFNNSALAGLQIYNNSGNNAIFCKQSNSFVGLGTTSPIQKLHVVGQACKTEGGTAWAVSSDLRLKTVLGDYQKGLNEIIALQPVRFRYLENNPRHLSSDIEQVGFVAQDVQEIFPEAVSEAEDGYLDFNIHAINIALVNAIKELKAENDRLKTENREQNSRIERLESLFSARAQNE